MKTTYFIEGMHCAACVSNVEKVLKKVKGVRDATVNLAMKSATIDSLSPISSKILKKNLNQAGYSLVENSTENLTKRQSTETDRWKKRFYAISVLGIPLLLLSMWEMFISSGPPNRSSILIQFLMTTPIVIIGNEYFRQGLKSLLYKSPNMNSLVALGTGAAYIYSLISSVNLHFSLEISGFEKLYFESAGVILMFITFGRWLEARAKGRTTEALTALLDTAPKTGWVKCNNDWIEKPVNDIQIGD
ncbi:MAG: cation transporter, partial [Fidelibacterota bacterium]